MSIFDEARADVAALLGLDETDVAGRTHMAVDIDGIGQLHVEEEGETLLLYLARPLDVGADRLGIYRTALRSVHFENALPVRVQCALFEEKLVFLARQDRDQATLPDLERSLDLLVDLHHQAAA